MGGEETLVRVSSRTSSKRVEQLEKNAAKLELVRLSQSCLAAFARSNPSDISEPKWARSIYYCCDGKISFENLQEFAFHGPKPMCSSGFCESVHIRKRNLFLKEVVGF